MAVQARIHSLQQRHQQLENELDALMRSPSTRDEEIAELKRQKLQVKDTIAVLKKAESVH